MGAGQSGGMQIAGSPMGYQVLRVYPNSPGSKAGLKAYFDFIVAIGNSRFAKEDGSLREILKASIDQKLKMVVYNTRSKTAREVEIVPSTSWGGSGLLGVSIKHSSFDRADERVWHVVEVDPGSPAHQAGFRALEDYVIGSDSILQENDDLYNLIETHEGKALKLFVYNFKSDNCREVICHPNSKWGGRGYLGCEFGHGLLHRIPYADSQRGVSSSSTGPAAAASTPANSNSGDIGSMGFNRLLQTSQTMGQMTASNGNTAQDKPNPLGQVNALPAISRLPSQPGNQMFQQALFCNTSDQSPYQQQQQRAQVAQQQQTEQQQQQQQPSPYGHPVQRQQHQPQTQVPQTFAQLAGAQYQTDPSGLQQPPSPPQQPQYEQLPPNNAPMQPVADQGPPTTAQVQRLQQQRQQQQQQQQQQQPQQPNQLADPYSHRASLLQTQPQVPQTFAQLASAQAEHNSSPASPPLQYRQQPFGNQPPVALPAQQATQAGPNMQQQQQPHLQPSSYGQLQAPAPELQAPQTFAQLAEARYQMQQKASPPPTQPQLYQQQAAFGAGAPLSPAGAHPPSAGQLQAQQLSLGLQAPPPPPPQQQQQQQADVNFH